jgi:hypothetical protein
MGFEGLVAGEKDATDVDMIFFFKKKSAKYRKYNVMFHLAE